MCHGQPGPQRFRRGCCSRRRSIPACADTWVIHGVGAAVHRNRSTATEAGSRIHCETVLISAYGSRPSRSERYGRRPWEKGQLTFDARSSLHETGRACATKGGCVNARLPGRAITQHCELDAAGFNLLDAASRQFQLSARSCHRVMKVARTIVDLAGVERITADRVAEAVQLRMECPSPRVTVETSRPLHLSIDQPRGRGGLLRGADAARLFPPAPR